MAEHWKSITGFKSYEVSSEGRVRNVVGGQGTTAGKIVKGVPNKKGYPVVSLRKNGRTHTRYVHDLVSDHFVGKKKKSKSVQHGNHKRTDNRATNLSTIDAKDNSGEGRISKKKIRQARALSKKKVGNSIIAKRLGLRSGVVRMVTKK